MPHHNAQEVMKWLVSNLRGLQLAWIAYAQNNNDKIVDSTADPNLMMVPVGERRTMWRTITRAWISTDIVLTPDYETATSAWDSEHAQVFMKVGSLYPYVRSEKVFRCPNASSGEMRTYTIVDSMKGVRDPNILNNNIVGGTVLWINNMMDIKNPSSRMVFIDTGMRNFESFRVHYYLELWKQAAPCRHSNGNTFSFADGHAEYWKWQGADTITNALSIKVLRYNLTMRISDYRNAVGKDIKPATNGGYADLHRFQKAVWGRLGYTPTPTE
jgi:prepilin-type processing-associated H-X9-DG protein